MKDLITIIIPVYNVEKYIEKCVNSVIGQTYNNLEIILVDDGAKDNSGKLCDQLALTDNRITVIHKENGGLSDARNAGIRIATGTFIAFIDSDDYIDEKYIETLYSNAICNNADIAISDFLKFSDKDDSSEVKAIEATDIKVFNTKQALDALYQDEYAYQFTTAWGKLFKSSLLVDFSYPVGRNYEDTATTHILIARASSVVYINRKQYFYLMRESSITKAEKYVKDDVILAVKDRVEWFEKSNYPDLLLKARIQYVTTMMGVHARLGNNKNDKSRKENLYKSVSDYIKAFPEIQCVSKKFLLQIKLFVIFPSIYDLIVGHK